MAATARAAMNRHTRQYETYLKSDEWRKKRQRILKLAGDLCERCREAKAIEVHHLTYVRLGRERDSDLQALCKPCHRIADNQRAYNAAFETYAAKRWGDHSDDYSERDYEEFDQWLESKEERYW